MSKVKSKGDVYLASAYNLNAARKDLESLGVPLHAVDHTFQQALEISTELVLTMDAVVEERLSQNKCVHPESLCLAMAFMAEKFLPMRFNGSGAEGRIIDPIKCVEMMRKLVEIKNVDESANDVDADDADDKPVPPTIH